jgi:hypothetical protein
MDRLPPQIKEKVEEKEAREGLVALHRRRLQSPVGFEVWKRRLPAYCYRWSQKSERGGVRREGMEEHKAAKMRDASTAAAPPADEVAVVEAAGGGAGGGADVSLVGGAGGSRGGA